MIQVSVELLLGMGVGLLLALIFREQGVARLLLQTSWGCCMGVICLVVAAVLFVLSGLVRVG